MIKDYRLTESEKQAMFDLLKKQIKKVKYYKDSPVFDYLINCRENTRFYLYAKDQEKQIKKPLKNISLFFKNVCENLASIYQVLHDKNINTKELDKATSQLYNVLNKLEKEDSNNDTTQEKI